MEFQPSGFGKGTYLNVGVQWLWRRFPAHSFEVRAPDKRWIPYESQEQFVPEVERLAILAADHVHTFRRPFHSLGAVADYWNMPSDTANSLYNSAIALGLLGRRRPAAVRFARFVALDDDRDWMLRWKREAELLGAFVAHTPAFQGAVQDIVAQTRAALKLPPAVVSFGGYQR